MRNETPGDNQPLTPEFLLRLQQQAGNQAVLKLIRMARQTSIPQMLPLTRNEMSEDCDSGLPLSLSWWKRFREWLLRLITFGLIRRQHGLTGKSER
ncbi:hypothetical protein E3A20_22190 [Planctomyces bekefii]|uniref:Uncharacterized protein n=1 Tax=Planctomyces bekefii TaxID=1653850 RepID=A0A5C6M3M0_9PLAN|nr:hypothetical protein E3A20_22190 [Planctomyces bekefii]